jgi:hydrogenase maturation protein HypF
MIDNGLESPVIGVVLDGTGYGTDGNIWGGEFLVADYQQFTRMGHVEYLPLPGGALAIKKPYRIAIGYLLSLFGEDGLRQDPPCLKQLDSLEIDIIKKQIESKINSPLTSSCGRLFDAVSALIGIRGEIGYEAQAAIELEMVAYDEADETDYYPFSIIEQDSLNIIKLQDLFSAILYDLQSNTSKATISVKFHNTIARMTNKLCQIISHKKGISQVVLSGGVFQNRLLLRKTVGLLEANGFTVFTHKQVPCNDGGISLGQAVIANFRS